jgi:chromosome segregation ATPase
MDHISRLTNERDLERMRFIAQKNELVQQAHKLYADLEGVRETLDSSLKMTNISEETLAVTSACWSKLEERVDARLVHSQKLDDKIRSLLVYQGSLSRNLRLRDRVNTFLKRSVDDLVAVISSSVRERKSLVAHLNQIQNSYENVQACVAVSTTRISDIRRARNESLQKLMVSCRESETARECLTKEIDSMRDEYMQSITVVDELMQKKLGKHEQALVKLHLLYESERKDHEDTKSKLDEAIIREKALHESAEQIAAENQINEKNIRTQSEQKMHALVIESDLRRESLQRKLDMRQKDLVDLEESLDKLRTSSKVKDEVIADLSSQLRDFKEQVVILERDKDLKHDERVESMTNEIRSHLRDTEQIKRQLEETEMALQQKDQLVHYVSAEINGIKEAYEAKLTSQTETHAIEISKMRQKLAEAVIAIKHLDNMVQENQKQTENLQVKLEESVSDKMRLEKYNSQKISQIKCILGESLS